MEFMEFTEQLRTEVEKLCGGSADVKIQMRTGNNGVVYTALNIAKLGERMSPVIHVDAYYENCMEGHMSVRTAAEEICGTFSDSQMPLFGDELSEEFEKIKNRITYSLVDYGRNKEMLKNTPYIPYCDLAIIFCLSVRSSMGRATAILQKEHLELWNVDTSTLYELAKANTPRLFPAEIKSMGQVMREIMGNDTEEELLGEITKGAQIKPMYILSNHVGYKGAAAVLYEGVLKNFAEDIGRDLFILPSSIHEVILVPYEKSLDAVKLQETVRHINQTEVPEEQVLSDNVYLYSRKTGLVTMAVENLAWLS